jgi:diadenosine tetraphosphate (Ap4A) HIT family hydrolase
VSQKPSEPLFETPYWDIRLSFKQVYVGRAIVILRRKCPNLSEVTVEKYEGAATKAFAPDLFNWSCLMNNAFRKEHPQPQVHWHVRPRYSKPLTSNGKVYEDINFASHYDIALGAEETPDASQEDQLAIATKIRKYLV